MKALNYTLGAILGKISVILLRNDEKISVKNALILSIISLKMSLASWPVVVRMHTGGVIIVPEGDFALTVYVPPLGAVNVALPFLSV